MKKNDTYDEIVEKVKPEIKNNKDYCLLPIEIVKDKTLKANEKILLSEIVVQNHYNGEFFGTNQYLASLVSLSSSRVSGILTNLKKRRYISMTFFRCPETKIVWKRVIKPIKYSKTKLFLKDKEEELNIRHRRILLKRLNND